MWKDSETDIDLLDFDYLVGMVKDIVENDNLTPSSIGVYGDWGSGKSSLAEMALKELSKEEDFVCLKFNGWLFEDYEDAKTALIGSILDKIAENRTIKGKAKDKIRRLYESIDFLSLASKGVKYGADFLLTGGIGTIADLTISTAVGKLKESNLNETISQDQIEKSMEAILKKSDIRDHLKCFQEDFEDLLKETHIKKLVVFIDELDRCDHNTILETLEAIRLFLFAPGTSFILGADERQVMYAVRKKFPKIEGNHIDIGKEYLEKMIQYPIKIPQLGVLEVEYYITCLLFKESFPKEFDDFIGFVRTEKNENFIDYQIDFKTISKKFPSIDQEKLRETIALSKQISSVLAKSLKGNPRHCKRFLNSLSMRIKMASFRNLILDKKILAKIMLIEYFKDDFYEQLNELQVMDEGKPEELIFIENDEWKNTEKLKVWKDDKWIANWIKLEPKLSNLDLKPYFYFTRESLNQSNVFSSSKLSFEANSILQNLFSKSDLKLQHAIDNGKYINEFESKEILKQVFNRIETSSEIEDKLFKVFMEWGSSKPELHSSVIINLDKLPAEKIKPSFIPRVISFFKLTKNNEVVLQLLDRWKNEKPRLKKIIEQELK